MKSHLIFAVLTTVIVSAEPDLLHNRDSKWVVGQTVQTTSGPVAGHASLNASGVSVYLGIPYAMPPIGDLRWTAPQRYSGTILINGTGFGFTCPNPTGATTVPPLTPDVIAKAHLTPVGIATLQALGESGTFSEDCLTLNVWTKPQVGDAKKAVMIWIHGGGFNTGGSNASLFDMQYFVDEEDVIVVTLNYRLNIFGFPGNPTGSYNLGLLDQRMGITLFGQSAGGASVDYYSYAWTDDPIITGFISESGTVFGLPASTQNVSHTAWFSVASNVGCGNVTTDPSQVLDCMRTKDFNALYQAFPQTTSLGGSFGPTIDEKVVFGDYVALGKAGKLIKKPLFIGSNNNEAELFKITAILSGQTVPDAVFDAMTLNAFTCPAGERANVSVFNELPTWRYRYFGDFEDQRLTPTSGAYHGAELAMLFNFFPLAPATSPTSLEISIAKYMRGAWAAFAKDSVAGLSSYDGGFPTYDPSTPTLVRLAFDNKTGTNPSDSSIYDLACGSLFPLKSSWTPGNGTTGNGTTSPGGSGSPIPESSTVQMVATSLVLVMASAIISFCYMI